MTNLTFNKKTEAGRPMLKPVLTPVDWILEIISMIALLTFFGIIIYQYPHLPETIPTHFNGSGIPDGFDSKDTIWSLPVISLFLYVLLSLINFIPHKFNYPVKITEKNALRQYTMATRLIRMLKLLLIIMFFYISHGTVSVALGYSSGLGFWFLPIFLGLFFIPVIIYFLTSSRKR